MRVALISLNNISRGYLPLGLAYLAGSLRKVGHTVMLCHSAISTERGIIEQCKQFCPEVIGFSFMTPYVNNAKAIARLLKENGRIIIAGGPHASALPEDVLSESAIDFVALQEGELTLVELLGALQKKRHIDTVMGIAYRDGQGKINFTPARPLIKDLDSLAKPSYSLLPMERYIRDFRINPSFGFKGITIMVSRGCPYNCIFCQSIHGKIPRYRNIDTVIKEMIELKIQYRLEGFNFCDDTLTFNENWMLGLCKEIGYHKELKNIIWSCNSRVDKISPELLGRMAKAGCRTIWLGIESGVQKTLDLINKETTIDQAIKACQWVRESKIGLRVNVIIGFPWEDELMIYETIRFVKSLKPDQIQFSCATPYPGTQLYQQVKDSSYLKFKDFSYFDYSERAVMVSDYLDIKKLEKIRKSCLYELFLDIRFFLRSIFYNLHSYWQLLGYLQRFKDKFFNTA